MGDFRYANSHDVDVAPAGAARSELVPGKRALTDRLAPPAAPGLDASGAVRDVAVHAGEHVRDGGNFVYVIRANGSFEVIGAPPAFSTAVGKVITPAGQYVGAWLALADKVRALPAKPTVDAAPAAASNAARAAASNAAPPAPEAAAVSAPVTASASAPSPQTSSSGQASPALQSSPEPMQSLPRPNGVASGEQRFRARANPLSSIDVALGKADGDKATRYERPKDAPANATAEEREQAKLHSAEFAKSQASGDAGTTAFYCSGFSIWTLAATGYDVSKTIVGDDGKEFTYTTTRPKLDAKGKKVMKDGVPVMREEPITLKQLLDGETPAVEAAALIEKLPDRNGASVGALFGAGHAIGHGTTGKAKDDSLAVKGAAGAFVLARIGAEVPELEQKPGDFAQSRRTTYPPGADGKPDKTKPLAHLGAGHAWQVVSVTVTGSAMFGHPGSPKVLASGLTGWQDNLVFTIDKDTDPLLVGAHTVLRANRVEANTPGAPVADKHDDGNDGGVHLTPDHVVPDNGKDNKYTDYIVYYGRLGTSRWTGWKPAQRPAG